MEKQEVNVVQRLSAEVEFRAMALEICEAL